MTDEIISANTLSTEEQTKRDQAESNIKEGLHKMWIGFRDMRDGKLWRSTHKSFAHYCQEMWNHKDKRGYQLAEAGDVVALLLEAGESTVLPANERHARALTGFPTDLRPVIMKTVENLASTLKRNITAEMIERVGDTLMQAVTTGVADVAGEATPLTAALLEGEYEAAQRHQEYIRNGSQWEYERSSKYRTGRAGTFEVLQMLADLDPSIEHTIRAYKEKQNDHDQR